jgi:hypothetical protein
MLSVVVVLVSVPVRGKVVPVAVPVVVPVLVLAVGVVILAMALAVVVVNVAALIEAADEALIVAMAALIAVASATAVPDLVTALVADIVVNRLTAIARTALHGGRHVVIAVCMDTFLLSVVSLPETTTYMKFSRTMRTLVMNTFWVKLTQATQFPPGTPRLIYAEKQCSLK